MNIYKIGRSDDYGWDEHEEAARKIHPNDILLWDDEAGVVLNDYKAG